MSVNLNLVTYTPTDAAAADDVLKNGNIGNIINRALEGDTLTITTDKGTFVFNAAGLEDPQNVTTDKIAGALSSLNNMMNHANSNAMISDVFALMQLLQDISDRQRVAARESRMEPRDQQLADISKQVEEMKRAAIVSLAMGIVSGTPQTTGFAVQIGSGASGVKVPSSSTKGVAAASGKGTEQVSSTAAKAAEASKGAEILAGKGASTASISNGAGGLSNAIGQGASGELNAEATKHQAEAAKAGAAAQNETDFINTMRDLIRNVQEKLQSILASEADTLKTILRA